MRYMKTDFRNMVEAWLLIELLNKNKREVPFDYHQRNLQTID